MPASGNEEKAGDLFSTGCPFSALHAAFDRITTLKARFNHAYGRTRLALIFSPA
jgi:hypothetical protein